MWKSRELAAPTGREAVFELPREDAADATQLPDLREAPDCVVLAILLTTVGDGATGTADYRRFVQFDDDFVTHTVQISSIKRFLEKFDLAVTTAFRWLVFR